LTLNFSKVNKFFDLAAIAKENARKREFNCLFETTVEAIGKVQKEELNIAIGELPIGEQEEEFSSEKRRERG